MSKPKHDDRMHPNRYERAPDERSLNQRYGEALDEITRLRAERDRWQHTADTQDDLLNQQAQRIAALEGALNEIAHEDCIDEQRIAREALAKEQDDE